LAKIEEARIEIGPLVQSASVNVVSQVIDVIEAHTCRLWIAAFDPFEVNVVDRALRAVAVDQINLQTTNALYGRNV
jgi:hypothetical protein